MLFHAGWAPRCRWIHLEKLDKILAGKTGVCRLHTSAPVKFLAAEQNETNSWHLESRECQLLLSRAQASRCSRDDPELEPVLHKAFPGFHGFRLALQVLRLTCAVEVSGMNEDPRSHIPSTKLFATLVQKLAIVSSCRTWDGVLNSVRRSHTP